MTSKKSNRNHKSPSAQNGRSSGIKDGTHLFGECGEGNDLGWLKPPNNVFTGLQAYEEICVNCDPGGMAFIVV